MASLLVKRDPIAEAPIPATPKAIYTFLAAIAAYNLCIFSLLLKNGAKLRAMFKASEPNIAAFCPGVMSSYVAAYISAPVLAVLIIGLITRPAFLLLLGVTRSTKSKIAEAKRACIPYLVSTSKGASGFNSPIAVFICVFTVPELSFELLELLDSSESSVSKETPN
jgi:hypothetical protein